MVQKRTYMGKGDTADLRHRTFVFNVRLKLTRLLLLPMLNKLGAGSGTTGDSLTNFGCLRFGSTCARYLSYCEKLKFLDLFFESGAPCELEFAKAGVVLAA